MSVFRYRQYANEVATTLDSLPWNSIHEMVHILHGARLAGKQVFIMGNGGSAATASHMACDLAKNTNLPAYPRFRVMALTDNVPLLLACGNDNGYEEIFVEQLANFLNEGDILIAISASGNSPNVIKAVQYARRHGAITIGWSGYSGGQLAEIVDMAIVVSNHCIEQIEDIHLMLEHMVTVGLRETLQESALRSHRLDIPTLPAHKAEVQTLP